MFLICLNLFKYYHVSIIFLHGAIYLSMIVLEGIDGCGKSTIARLLAKELNLKVLHFPSKGAEKVRLHLKMKKVFSKEQLFLLFLSDILASRSSVSGKVIDRYIYSTVAYQHGIFQLNFLEKFFTCLKFPKPDLVVYLDIPVSVALQRISGSRMSKSVFERKSYLTNVKREYDKMFANQFFGTWLKIDARKNPALIVKEIVGFYRALRKQK